MKKYRQSSAIFIKKPTVVATQVALAVFAQLAYAQQQPVQTAERVERVEITGTRLPALTVEGPSPITTLNSQEIRMDGLQKTEDLLNNLPQVTAAQGTNASNGATGTAQVNLRALGPTRNLVLINGRRLPPGSPATGGYTAYAADLNQIPAPLIQRVELLTGGASAVYGSDAISGVVNFIMNDRFEGLQLDVNNSFYNHRQQQSHIQDIIRQHEATNPSQFQVPGNVGSDGKVWAFSALVGRNFADNKGNATLFFGYKKEDPVIQRNRDFSACSLGGGDDFDCLGSSTSATGRFRLRPGATQPFLTVADAAGNLRTFNNDTDLFNFGPYNYFRRPSEQYSMNAFAHLDVAPKARVYSELGFHDNRTDAQIAPSGSFGSIFTLHGSNPLLSASELAAFGLTPGVDTSTATVQVNRRNVEGDPRVDDIRHSSYRGVLGLKGDVLTNWSYDAYLQHGKVLYQDIYRGDFSKVKIGRALDVITNPATGQPACRSAVPVSSGGTGDDPNCVPWNIWHLGGVTKAATDYLQTPGIANGSTQQTVISATASTDLGHYGARLPTAKTGVALVIGAERRKEKLNLDTDIEFTTFDLAGQGGPIIGISNKSLNNDDIFGEVRVPLIEGRPFADLASVSASYRHSDYSTNKKTSTYGFGAEWAPVKNYRLRGSYQKAIRHANIVELFQANGTNLFGLSQDPCGPKTTTPTRGPTATLAQCLNTGLPASLYGDPGLFNTAGQYNYLQGGNPDLSPETANTWTFGLVMTPTRNLTASIDWWSIRIEQVISTPPPGSILTACLNRGEFCNLIHRDASGTLWLPNGGFITATNQNLGLYYTTGIDLGASWTQRLGALGNFGVHFNGSYMPKWEAETFPGTGRFDCAGFYGPTCGILSGSPLPKWRHKMRFSWATPANVDLALTWRHIDKVKHEGTSGNPLLNDPEVAATDKVLGAREYFDIAAIWTINKTFSLRAGVNNIFDKDPPITGTTDPSFFGNGNTFPQTYDALGRLVFLNLTMKF